MNNIRKTARTALALPGDAQSLLLHSCCAPCAGGVLETLVEAGIAVTLFFCNPNIHPDGEYRQRRDEQGRFAAALGVPFVDADYTPEAWLEQTAELADAPERGARCRLCFQMRLETTAHYAAEHGFPVFASTLGISRWKDLAQVNEAGRAAAEGCPATAFWPFNWRKNGGSQRMTEVARREGFYQQEYCGCTYSLRDTNRWRRQRGRPPIVREIP